MGFFATDEEKIRRMSHVIRAGYKRRPYWRLGPEFEHLVLERETGRRITYFEPDGLQTVLEELSALHPDWMRVEGKDHALIGLEGEEIQISLEPGGQFELSVAPSMSIAALRETYFRNVEEVDEVLRPKGYALCAIGVDPENWAENIPLLPKTRYEIMDEEMTKQGDLARAMMRQSCAFQLSFDVADDRDFVAKYQALAVLSPIFATLFDSGFAFEGKKLKKYNARQEIWRRTDPRRTGFPPDLFDPDFGVESYCQWILHMPPLFWPNADGSVTRTGEKTLSELLDEASTGEEADALILHAMSIAFPQIRMKQIMEFRVMDAVPPEWAFGACAMLKGLIYSRGALQKLQFLFEGMQMSWIERGQNAAREHGLRGYYHSDYYADWGIYLVKLIKPYLSAEDAAFLLPLIEAWEEMETPRSVLERAWEEGGMPAVVRAAEVHRVVS